MVQVPAGLQNQAGRPATLQGGDRRFEYRNGINPILIDRRPAHCDSHTD